MSDERLNFVVGVLVGVVGTLIIKPILDGGKGKLPVIEYTNGEKPKELVQPEMKN